MGLRLRQRILLLLLLLMLLCWLCFLGLVFRTGPMSHSNNAGGRGSRGAEKAATRYFRFRCSKLMWDNENWCRSFCPRLERFGNLEGIYLMIHRAIRSRTFARIIFESKIPPFLNPLILSWPGSRSYLTSFHLCIRWIRHMRLLYRLRRIRWVWTMRRRVDLRDSLLRSLRRL